MVGWFALNVPSGLSLYYFSNTVLTGATQVFLRKLGGERSAWAPNLRSTNCKQKLTIILRAWKPHFAAHFSSTRAVLFACSTTLSQFRRCCCAGAKAAEFDLGPLELGKARRTGTAAASLDEASTASDSEAESNGNGAAEALAFSAAEQDDGAAAEAALAAAAAAAPPQVNRRCKRKRRELLEV